jgi:hypothetical protein
MPNDMKGVSRYISWKLIFWGRDFCSSQNIVEFRNQILRMFLSIAVI